MSKKNIPNKYTTLKGSGGGMSSSFKMDTLTELGKMCFATVKDTVGNVGKIKGYSSKGMYMKWFEPTTQITQSIMVARDKLLDLGVDVELIETTGKDMELIVIKEEYIIHAEGKQYAYTVGDPYLIIQNSDQLPPKHTKVKYGYALINGVVFFTNFKKMDRLVWINNIPYYRGLKYITLLFKN